MKIKPIFFTTFTVSLMVFGFARAAHTSGLEQDLMWVLFSMGFVTTGLLGGDHIAKYG